MNIKTIVWRLYLKLNGQLPYKEELAVETERIGNDYGGWYFYGKTLDKKSIIYSFGIGDDITFDLELVKRGCTVYAFDPTPRSIKWLKNQKLPKRFKWYPYGVGSKDETKIFYAPKKEQFVSYSVIQHDSKDQGTKLVVYKLSTIMRKLGHKKVDLLKIDIEGSEYEVIESIKESKIEVSQILVEFHHRFSKFSINDTKRAVNMLKGMGYKIFAISKYGEEYSFMKIF